MHRPEILVLLGKFVLMWAGHLWRISTAKHRIELNGDDFSPAHSAPYRAGLTLRQFAAAEVSQVLREEVIEPATT